MQALLGFSLISATAAVAVGPTSLVAVSHIQPRARLLRGSGVQTDLRDAVRRDRAVRFGGLALGGSLVLSCCVVGVSAGMFDPLALSGSASVVLAGTAAARGYQYVSAEETRQPMDEATSFVVGPSAGRGQGLFALVAIPKGAYLFMYEGEVLDEDQFFERYPDGDGRYIAAIGDDLYIDGASAELSNVARWMNHDRAANVMWRKQTIGPNRAMHFYATADISAGEELRFDYGSEYWEALGEVPLES